MATTNKRTTMTTQPAAACEVIAFLARAASSAAVNVYPPYDPLEVSSFCVQ